MTRRCTLPALIVALITTLAPASRSATAIAVAIPCAGTVSWTFSPPLTRVPQSGTVGQQFDGACMFAGVALVTSPPFVGELVYGGVTSSTSSGSYVGNCELALVTLGGVQHLLLRASLVAAESLDPAAGYAAAHVLTPDQPCDATTSVGPGTFSATITQFVP